MKFPSMCQIILTKTAYKNGIIKYKVDNIII